MQVMTPIYRWFFAALLALIMALGGCGSSKTEDAAKTGPAKEYPMHGEIRGLDSGQHVATIKHDEIPGFMKAMTMGYPVKDQAEFSKLKVGDQIDGTLYVKDDDMWVGNIRQAQK
jgi:Cu/Ag efflux protein CusF